MKAIVSVNIQDLKPNPKEEIDELLGEMHDLQNECGNLKSELATLKKKRQGRREATSKCC